MAPGPERDWSPFRVCAPGERAPKARGMNSPEGLGDRLRTAAFAELQAREAFAWAAEAFAEAPEELRAAWRRLAAEEDKHLGWLLERMSQLGVDPAARPVSRRLWDSLTAAPSLREFAAAMFVAEDRGREAEAAFEKNMAARDPESARIFGRIASEEEEHLALARRFFPGIEGPTAA